jgi:hypothetical protein
MSEAPSGAPPRVARPFGLWAMPLVDCLLAFAFVFFSTPRFLFPPPHAALPPDARHYMLFALAVVTMGAAYGVWAGSRTARKVLLGAIALVLPVFVYGMTLAIQGMSRQGEMKWLGYALLEFAWASDFIIVLLALNWWASRDKRARAFFGARSAGQSWFAARGILLAGIGPAVLLFAVCEALYRFTGMPSLPPPILADQLRDEPAAGLGEWEAFNRFLQLRAGPRAGPDPVEAEQSRRFTALLESRFPSGSSEAALVSALKAEDFREFQPDTTECTPDPKAPGGSRCRELPAPARVLAYQWWRFHGLRRGQCVEAVRVEWEASHGKLTEVKGEYTKICGFFIEPRHWNYW